MQQIAAAWLLLAVSRTRPSRSACSRSAMLLPTTVLGLFVGTVDRPLRRAANDDRVRGAGGRARRRVRGADARRLDHRLARSTRSSVVGGVVAALDGPARHALVFQMVGPKDLPNAVALMSSLGTTRARARPRDRRLRRRLRRPGRRVRAQRRELRRRSSAACSRSTRSRLLRARRDREATRPRRRAPTRCASSAARAARSSRSSPCSRSRPSRSTSTCCCRSSPTSTLARGRRRCSA